MFTPSAGVGMSLKIGLLLKGERSDCGLSSMSFLIETNSICDEFTTTSISCSLIPDTVVHPPGSVDDIFPDVYEY